MEISILMVDDDRILVEKLEETVDWKRIGISMVFTANNIRQAQKILEEFPIQILLCDIDMPQGSGLELLEWLRNQEIQTECIFLSSYANFAYAQKALQEMKNDLTLPLDLLNLVSDNSVTNLSAPKITYLVTKVSGSSFSADNIQSIECNIKEGETGYAEYYPDETKLFEMILKVFYKQVS